MKAVPVLQWIAGAGIQQERRGNSWHPALLALLLLGAAAVALAPDAASAASANCGSGSFSPHYWGFGHHHSGTATSGAQATIESRAAALCNPPAGKIAQSAGFAGLFNGGSGNAGGFAWVGWINQTSVGRDVAIDISIDGSSATITTLFSISQGTTYKYKTSWQNNDDGFIHFIQCNADGSGCTDWGHTSFQGSIWSDIQGRVVGHTDTSDADLPGVSSTHNLFSSILWREGTGAWITSGHTDLSDGVSRYHMSDIDNSDVATWTNPL